MARKPKLREFEWGETPFDGMEYETLKHHALRLMITAERLCGELSKLKHMGGDPDQPYWQPGGAGAGALEYFNQAHGPLVAGIDSESAYRSFFRYAGSLLFNSTPENQLNRAWVICPVCKTMWGNGTMVGKQCGVAESPHRCTGIYRPLEWADMQKIADKAAEPVND